MGRVSQAFSPHDDGCHESYPSKFFDVTSTNSISCWIPKWTLASLPTSNLHIRFALKIVSYLKNFVGSWIIWQPLKWSYIPDSSWHFIDATSRFRYHGIEEQHSASLFTLVSIITTCIWQIRHSWQDNQRRKTCFYLRYYALTCYFIAKLLIWCIRNSPREIS